METEQRLADERKNVSVEVASGRAEASQLFSSNDSAKGIAGGQSD